IPHSQHSTVPAFHIPTIPHSQHSTFPAFHIPTIPHSQHSTVPAFHIPTIPHSQHSTVPPFHIPSIPQSQHSTFPAFHSPSIPHSHHSTFPPFHIHTTLRTHGSVRHGHPYVREYRVGLDLRRQVRQPHSQTYDHHQPLTSGFVNTSTTDQRTSQAFDQPTPEFSSQLQPQTSGQLHLPQTSGQLHPQSSIRRYLQVYSQLNLEATNQILSTTSISETDNDDQTDDFLTYRLREESETDPDIIEVNSDDNIDDSSDDNSDESIDDSADDSSDDSTYDSSDDSTNDSSDNSTYDSSDDNSNDSSDNSTYDSSDDSLDDILIVEEPTENKTEICSLESLEGSSLSSKDESLTPEMCSRNAVGECHELACPFVHGQICEFCKKPNLHPTNVKQRSQHMQDCLFEQSKDKKCEVCFETILQPQSESRFGLQQNCKHCFCISCLSTWGENKKMANHKACPTCRTDSGRILSSKYWIELAEVKGPIMQHFENIFEETDEPYQASPTVLEVMEIIF
ncbi:E3 ubiquitin-protein ligase makorin-1, partial [Biomphalaria glabrata]